MRRATLGGIAVALLVTVAPSAPAGHTAAAPVIVAAGPRADPSDRPGGGFLRVTFSPDGDGRRDEVRIRVRSTPGDRLVLKVVRESRGGSFVSRGQEDVDHSTLTWNGKDADGNPQPEESYVLEACSAVTGRCASTRVLAHLRILSAYVPRATAVSVGATVPVVLSTDRAGPFTLDLTHDGRLDAPGFGALVVHRPGRVAYPVPEVAGGLWLLRVRSGSVVTHFPLVVHQPDRPLDE